MHHITLSKPDVAVAMMDVDKDTPNKNNTSQKQTYLDKLLTPKLNSFNLLRYLSEPTDDATKCSNSIDETASIVSISQRKSRSLRPDNMQLPPAPSTPKPLPQAVSTTVRDDDDQSVLTEVSHNPVMTSLKRTRRLPLPQVIQDNLKSRPLSKPLNPPFSLRFLREKRSTKRKWPPNRTSWKLSVRLD